MKRILLAASALVLSGCNWMGSGYGHHNHNQYQHGGYYSHNGYQAPVAVNPHGNHRLNNSTSLEFAVGAEEFVGGNVLPQTLGNGGVVNKVQYKDAFDTGWRASGGIAHNVAPRTTLIAKGFYKEADASNDPVRVFTNSAAEAVTGSFTDFKGYGAEVGFREYLNNHNGRAQLRPYMGATVGAAYLESLSVENVNGGAGSVDLYDGEWVPTASAVVGVELPVSNRFSMGVESGLRYEGKRESDIVALETSDAYSVPVTLRGRFRF